MDAVTKNKRKHNERIIQPTFFFFESKNHRHIFSFFHNHTWQITPHWSCSTWEIIDPFYRSHIRDFIVSKHFHPTLCDDTQVHIGARTEIIKDTCTDGLMDKWFRFFLLNHTGTIFFFFFFVCVCVCEGIARSIRFFWWGGRLRDWRLKNQTTSTNLQIRSVQWLEDWHRSQRSRSHCYVRQLVRRTMWEQFEQVGASIINTPQNKCSWNMALVSSAANKHTRDE